MSASEPWAPDIPNNFRHLYKQCIKRKDMEKRIDNAIETILSAERPASLGEVKKGDLQGTFAWELSGACRLVFVPIPEIHVVKFLRVCDHTQAY